MTKVIIDLQRDTSRDLGFYQCEVWRDGAERSDRLSFDITAAPFFLQLSEQEIIEQIAACDGETVLLFQEAADMGGSVTLNGVRLDMPTLRTTLAGLPQPDVAAP